MKTVILDAYTMNPGDLPWDGWENLGDFVKYDRTPKELVVQRAADAEIVLVNKVRMTAEVIAQLPKLRYIGVLATGYDVVDVKAAKEAGITVTNVPAYSTDSVAQLVFAFILEHCQKVALYSQEVHKGAWQSSPDFTFSIAPTIELAGKTLGVIGLGRIGMKVAEIGHAFGMKVIGYRRNPPAALPSWLALAPVETIFKTADFLTCHCPLTPETRTLIDAKHLSLMKPTAFLVNTSRGPVVDEQALADALNAGRIAGAAVDVLQQEPPSNGSPLLTAKNCLITPHLAWATKEARIRLNQVALENVKAFLAGKPVNVVS